MTASAKLCVSSSRPRRSCSAGHRGRQRGQQAQRGRQRVRPVSGYRSAGRPGRAASSRSARAAATVAQKSRHTTPTFAAQRTTSAIAAPFVAPVTDWALPRSPSLAAVSPPPRRCPGTRAGPETGPMEVSPVAGSLPASSRSSAGARSARPPRPPHRRAAFADSPPDRAGPNTAGSPRTSPPRRPARPPRTAVRRS